MLKLAMLWVCVFLLAGQGVKAMDPKESYWWDEGVRSAPLRQSRPQSRSWVSYGAPVYKINPRRERSLVASFYPVRSSPLSYGSFSPEVAPSAGLEEKGFAPRERVSGVFYGPDSEMQDQSAASGRLMSFSHRRPPLRQRGSAAYFTSQEDAFLCGKSLVRSGSYREGVKIFQALTDQGNLKAACQLGCCYLYGQGVEQNYEHAMRLFSCVLDKGAASQEKVIAQKFLADGYRIGLGVSKNIERARALYVPIQKENIAAKHGLALCLLEKGDYPEALVALSVCAAQEFSPSQYWMGVLYYDGIGVKRNIERAVDYFRKSACQGHAPAWHFLGVLFYRGGPLKQDREKAYKCFLNSAVKQGYGLLKLHDLFHAEKVLAVRKRLGELIEKGQQKAKGRKAGFDLTGACNIRLSSSHLSVS